MTAMILRPRITDVFHLKATIALVLLALGCFAGVDDVEFHEVRLADSLSIPTDLGVLALNQIGSGEFRRHLQWAAFEVAVAAGDYEIRAWGQTPQGGQDTFLYLFGPKTGGYPQSAMAVNDDADPSTESSALRLTLDGTYRIIVTTIANVQRGTVSVGTFHVVACPAGQCPKALVTVPTVPAPPRAPS
jgi:hypothetical protein